MNQESMRFGVLGSPIAHSKSPRMHMAAYRALGLPHVYEALLTDPEGLSSRVDALRLGEWRGLNVTVPHKCSVLALVDEVHPSAQHVGAANTLVRTIGSGGRHRVVAHNTDVPALAEEIRILSDRHMNRRASTAIVLGSGGAARAAVTALVGELGFGRVVVKARAFADRHRAQAFAGSFCFDAALVPEPLLPHELDGEARVVIQATSAGMVGADDGGDVASAVDWSSLDRGVAAIDLVYAPSHTPFLGAAERIGARHANGLGMLVRQGALAFQLWLGIVPPLDGMRAAIEE